MNGFDNWSYRIGTELPLKLFGSPFFLMGCFFFWIGATTDKINNGPPTFMMRASVCAFASVFILVGFSLIAGFKKIAINKRDKTLKKSWGILIPFYWKTEKLGDFEKIETTKEVRVSQNSKGSSSRRTVYPVRLIQNSLTKEVICEKSKLLKARQVAEDLCRFMQLPIIDSSTGVEIHRDADEVDFNIQQMMKKYGETVEKPTVPKCLQSTICEDYDHDGNKQTVILFPRHCQTDKGIFIGLLLVTLICSSFIAYHLLTFESKREGVRAFFDFIDLAFNFTFIIPSFGFLALFPKLLQAVALESVSISKSSLIHTRTLLLSWSRKVALNKLESLLINKINTKKGTAELHLLSDHQFLTILKHHKLEALEYIEQLVKFKVQNK